MTQQKKQAVLIFLSIPKINFYPTSQEQRIMEINMKNLKTIQYTLFSVAYLMLSQFVLAEQTDTNNYMRIQTTSKDTFSAYVVGPKNSKKAILLIHGWWGLTRNVESLANQFAVKGYRIMAIDLYDKQVTKNPARAKKLMKSVKQSIANEIYLTAIRVLAKPGRKVAVLGHSYGGAQTLHAASVGQDKVSAAIIYYPYGKLITEKKQLASIKAPVLGHFASDDYFLTQDKFDIFKSKIVKSNLDMTFKIYKAKHGFDKQHGKNYHEAASELAMNRTYQFLSKHLN